MAKEPVILNVSLVNFSGQGWGSEYAVPNDDAEAALMLLGTVKRDNEAGEWLVELSDRYTKLPYGNLPLACFIARADTGEIIGSKMTYGTTYLDLEALRK